MRLSYDTLRIPLLLLFFGGVNLFCETAPSQEIRWYPGRDRVIVSQTTKDRIQKLFQKSFCHRDQVISGQMDIVLHHTTIGKFENELNREMTLAFDAERQRVDRRSIQKNNPYAGRNIPEIAVGCIGCYNGDNQLLVTYSQYVKEDKQNEQSWLIINDKGQKTDEGQEWGNEWTAGLGFIPRYIVYFSGPGPDYRFPTKNTLDQYWDLLYANSLGMLESGVTDAAIIVEEYKGTNCTKVVLETKWDDGSVTRNTFWFAEEQGCALRKHHYEGTTYDELLEVDITLDKGSGIWFPSAWHYARNDNGKPRFIEDGVIKNVVLNKPIPDKIFTMQNIKAIPAGAKVVWHARRVPAPHNAKYGTLLWDGNDIVTRGMFNEGLIAKMAAENKSNRLKKILLVNVAAIGLILSLFLLRYYLHLKRQD